MKSKIVPRKNSMDEIPVRMTSSRTALITRIESNAKFPHRPVQTGFKNIIIKIMECLVVMENIYNVDARLKSYFVVLYCQQVILTTMVV